MAEIRIERKNTRLWLFLGGLVLLGLVVWGVAELAARERGDAALAAAAPLTVAPAAPPSAAPVAVDPTPLTDVALIVVPQRLPLVGRTVQLVGAPVLSVPGDSVFWVGTDPAHRMMVMLDETLPSGASTDAWIDVDPGQRVNVTGVIRPLPADVGPWRARLGLNAADLEALQRDAVYLAAGRVVITGGERGAAAAPRPRDACVRHYPGCAAAGPHANATH